MFVAFGWVCGLVLWFVVVVCSRGLQGGVVFPGGLRGAVSSSGPASRGVPPAPGGADALAGAHSVRVTRLV
jgi:hypothetical protein